MQESSAEMTVQSSGFQEYLAEEIKKYGGVMIPVKAGLMERLLVKEAEIKKLHPNPDDEFCMPGIGPMTGSSPTIWRVIRDTDR